MRSISILLLVTLLSCGAKNTKYVDLEKLEKGSILSLKAYLNDESDCGEWGGHEEVIQIGNVNDTLMFFYTRDSTECTIEAIRTKPLPSNIKTRHKGQLTAGMQRLVYDYIDEVYLYNAEGQGVSNAPDRYSIEFNSRYFNKELKIYPVVGWPKFIEFRDKMIND